MIHDLTKPADRSGLLEATQTLPTIHGPATKGWLSGPATLGSLVLLGASVLAGCASTQALPRAEARRVEPRPQGRFDFTDRTLAQLAETFNAANERPKILVEGQAAQMRFAGVLDLYEPEEFAEVVACDSAYELVHTGSDSLLLRLRHESAPQPLGGE